MRWVPAIILFSFLFVRPVEVSAIIGKTPLAEIKTPLAEIAILTSLTLVSFISWIALGVLILQIALFFHRGFIVIWNLVVSFTTFFVLMMVLMILVSRGMSNREVGFAGIIASVFVAIFHATFFTIVTFGISTVAIKFQKIRNFQEVFDRLSRNQKILVLVVLYVFFAITLILDFWVRVGRYAILVGEISLVVSVLFGMGFIYFIYTRAVSLPQKEILYAKKDFYHLGIIFLIFLGSLLFGLLVQY